MNLTRPSDTLRSKGGARRIRAQRWAYHEGSFVTPQVLLFSQHDVAAVLEHQRRQMAAAASQLPASDVARDTQPSTVERLVGDFAVKPLLIHPDQVTMAHEEAKVDVSQEPGRDVRDRGRPLFVPGQHVRYFVPYEGDKELWECRPSTFTWNAPRAEIRDGEVIFDFTVQGQAIAETKGMYKAALAAVQQWIAWSTADVQGHNAQLRSQATDSVRRRGGQLEAAARQVAEMGIPVRKAKPESTRAVAQEASVTARRSSHGAAASEMEYDVALSFAGEDRAYAEEVATLLREAGVRVFYDRFETAQLWGRNLADHLGDVYGRRARFVVMFISEHYPLKAWPTHERQSAQARAIRENRVVLLPARFDDTDIPGMPATTGYTDLRRTSPEGLVKLILQKLAEDV